MRLRGKIDPFRITVGFGIQGAFGGALYRQSGLRHPDAGRDRHRRPLPGYYVLRTPAPADDAKATILIAAQDSCFADKPVADAAAMAQDLARSTGHATPEPSLATIGGHPFARVAVGGSPHSRIVPATDIQCHAVIFTFTGGDPVELEKLAASLDRLSK